MDSQFVMKKHSDANNQIENVICWKNCVDFLRREISAMLIDAERNWKGCTYNDGDEGGHDEE